MSKVFRDTEPGHLYKTVVIPLFERLFSWPWRPWVKTKQVIDFEAELDRDHRYRMKRWYSKLSERLPPVTATQSVQPPTPVNPQATSCNPFPAFYDKRGLPHGCRDEHASQDSDTDSNSNYGGTD